MSRMIVVSGPTASGKSYVADLIACRCKSLIINADSMQIYEDLPTLTAQPKQVCSGSVQYKLYGILSYHEECSAGRWVKLAQNAIDAGLSSGKTIIIVGGTGFYLKSLIYGTIKIPEIGSLIRIKTRRLFMELGREAFYKLLVQRDPQIVGAIHANDTQRLIRAMEVYECTGLSITRFKDCHDQPRHTDYMHVCLFPNREFLYKNCDSRFDAMIKDGVIEEIQAFRDQIINSERKCMLENAIGFKQIMGYLEGHISIAEAIEKSQQATRNYAKRQLTWFRNQMPGKIRVDYNSISGLKQKLSTIQGLAL